MNTKRNKGINEDSMNAENWFHRTCRIEDSTVIDIFKSWRELSRTRERLTELNSRQLDDIGLDRSKL